MTSDSAAHFDLPSSALNWIASVLSCPPGCISCSRLLGSTSSSLFQVTLDGKSTRFVLRCHTNREWLAEEPDLIERESAALAALAQDDFPAPRLVAVDASGEHCSVPALLMTALPGQINLTPVNFNTWLQELAKPLTRLHAIPAPNLRWQYHPYVSPAEVVPPAWTAHPDSWHKMLEIARRPWPSFTPVFIHRDYHPVNVLFNGNCLSGIVDWPNACLGPAGQDIAWCRINLAFMFGPQAAEGFLQTCRTLFGPSFTYDPFWDILAMIESLPGPPAFYPPWAQFGLPITGEAEQIRRLDAYLEQVLSLF